MSDDRRPEYREAKDAAKARGESPLGRSLGLDYGFIARWVAAWDREKKPMNVDEVTAAGGGVLPTKGAITMKYAEREGLARKIKGEQPRWEPTEEALERFPPGEPHVMPDSETADVGGGTFHPLWGVARADDRGMGDNPGLIDQGRKELEGED
jgi:hypothetical protein